MPMNMRRGWLVLLLLATAGVAQEPASKKGPEEFTFLFWTDQELDPGKEDKLAATVEAMNGIAGKPYPEALGGSVGAPDFAASAGDSCGWPSHGAVQSWNRVVRELLKMPSRPVAGNHDSGGAEPRETFYDWMRKDPFIKEHASDNGLPAWTPPRSETGIIPGVNYSFRHKGVVFVMPSPTYDNSGKSPPGESPIYKHDLDWLKKELAKYDPKEPKIVVNHFNAGSIMNRSEIDALYKANNVLLHLCGHWEKVQHWRFGDTDWIMDGGHRAKDGTFSVVRVGRDSVALAHWVPFEKKWHEATVRRRIPARW
jgi:hypothetical protein